MKTTYSRHNLHRTDHTERNIQRFADVRQAAHPVVAQCSWFYMSYVVSWSTRFLFYLSSVWSFASGLSALGPVPGHVAREWLVARECPQARGSSQSSSVPVCEVSPDPVPVPDVSLDPALAPVSEVPPVPVPVSDVSLSSDSSSVEIEVSPPDPPEEPAPAPVPTPKPAKSSHAAKSSSPAADFKKLVRVALLKTKPGSSPAQVRRLVSSLISANKFVVSPDDVERVVESICNSK